MLETTCGIVVKGYQIAQVTYYRSPLPWMVTFFVLVDEWLHGLSKYFQLPILSSKPVLCHVVPLGEWELTNISIHFLSISFLNILHIYKCNCEEHIIYIECVSPTSCSLNFYHNWTLFLSKVWRFLGEHL